MKIGGLEPFSLSDYPGRTAAVVFAQGCNFRCPFCHNGRLVASAGPDSDLITQTCVLDFLGKRRSRLDGVVLSGGEPTIQPGLARFARWLKNAGFLVKLDTNGSRPDVLEHLLADALIDYIAMDIKAPLGKYKHLAGVPVDRACIRRSIAIIAAGGVEHEFRTTVVEPLLSAEDVCAIQRLVPRGSSHRLQPFRPENAQDPALRAERPQPIPIETVAIGTRRGPGERLLSLDTEHPSAQWRTQQL